MAHQMAHQIGGIRTMARTYGTGTVYQDKRGRWVVALDQGWTARGTRDRVRRFFRTEREAKQGQRQLLREADQGTSLTPTTTVKSWSDQWLPIHATQVRPHAYATDRTAVTKWIVPTIGRKRLASLTPADIRAVDLAQQDAGLAPASVIRTRAVLHKMLKDAHVEGHALPPRALQVKRPPKGEGGRDAIPLPHALSILAVASTKGDDIFLRCVLAFFGVRPDEVRGLGWECVSGEQIDISWQLKALPYQVARDRTSGFRVPVGFVARHLVGSYHLVRPKTGSGKRPIPMVPWLYATFLRWRETQGGSEYGLVFPRTTAANPRDVGKPMLEVAHREEWKALCVEAGVPAYDLYSARHTAVTEMLQSGEVDPRVAAEIVGHSKLVESYRHVGSRETTRAIEGLSKTLGLG